MSISLIGLTIANAIAIAAAHPEQIPAILAVLDKRVAAAPGTGKAKRAADLAAKLRAGNIPTVQGVFARTTEPKAKPAKVAKAKVAKVAPVVTRTVEPSPLDARVSALEASMALLAKVCAETNTAVKALAKR